MTTKKQIKGLVKAASFLTCAIAWGPSVTFGAELTAENKADLAVIHNLCRDVASGRCILEANRHFNGDVGRTMDLFRSACDAGDPFGCNNMGIAISNVATTDADKAKGLRYFEITCDARDGQGCYLLGMAYYHGSGVKKDAAKSFALYERGCEARYGGACNSLGVLYSKGEGVEQDLNKGLSAYSRACDRLSYAIACFNIAFAYENGKGVAADYATAQRFYSKACDLNDKAACGKANALSMRTNTNVKTSDLVSFPSISRQFSLSKNLQGSEEQQALIKELQTAETGNASTRQKLYNARNELPPPFLYYLAEYTFDADKNAALKWLLMGRVRARLDAILCADKTAMQGTSSLADIAPRVTAYARQNPKITGKVGLSVLADKDLLKSKASPWWICSHGIDAMPNAILTAMDPAERKKAGLPDPVEEKPWLIQERSMELMYLRIKSGNKWEFEKLISSSE